MREITYSFTTRELLHVGAGAARTGVRTRLAIQKRRGRPYIPGSTIRGKMRWNLTTIVGHLKKEAKGSLKDLIEGHGSGIVNAMFGSPDHEGFIVVGPATAVELVEPDIMPQVRIERSTRSVVSGALFFYEAVPVGVRFSGKVILRINEKTSEFRPFLLLVLLAIKRLEISGIGRRSARVAVDLGEDETILEELMKEMLA
ncbi:MAG: RAMP superfamily CRISPR-associated protein [Candidatus Thorarchaeota archaeon]